MTSYYESFCDVVLISEIGIKSHVVLHFLALFAFLTFPTLSIERLLEQSMISHFSAMVSLASMAMPADGNQKRGIWHHKFCSSDIL